MASVLKYHGKMWYNFVVPHFAIPNFASAKISPLRYGCLVCQDGQWLHYTRSPDDTGEGRSPEEGDATKPSGGGAKASTHAHTVCAQMDRFSMWTDVAQCILFLYNAQGTPAGGMRGCSLSVTVLYNQRPVLFVGVLFSGGGGAVWEEGGCSAVGVLPAPYAASPWQFCTAAQGMWTLQAEGRTQSRKGRVGAGRSLTLDFSPFWQLFICSLVHPHCPVQWAPIRNPRNQVDCQSSALSLRNPNILSTSQGTCVTGAYSPLPLGGPASGGSDDPLPIASGVGWSSEVTCTPLGLPPRRPPSLNSRAG